MLTAIILAGGLGTRLSGVIPHLPKALAPIRGVPFLDLILDQLQRSGLVTKVVLALGHRAESIQNSIEAKKYSFSTAFSFEKTPLGTGGALLNALDQTESKTLLVLNGDSYCDLSLADFYHFHKRLGADCSIACKKMEDTSRYGSIEMDGAQKVISFKEKQADLGAGWMNAGLYFIERSLLVLWKPGVYSLENDLFPTFLKKKTLAYCNTGVFIDIGTPQSYREAQDVLKPFLREE